VYSNPMVEGERIILESASSIVAQNYGDGNVAARCCVYSCSLATIWTQLVSKGGVLQLRLHESLADLCLSFFKVP
jgi:hypothetical protein